MEFQVDLLERPPSDNRLLPGSLVEVTPVEIEFHAKHDQARQSCGNGWRGYLPSSERWILPQSVGNVANRIEEFGKLIWSHPSTLLPGRATAGPHPNRHGPSILPRGKCTIPNPCQNAVPSPGRRCLPLAHGASAGSRVLPGGCSATDPPSHLRLRRLLRV